MLDSTTKRRIDSCRDILVGKVPDPKSQVEQITIALIYKFMDDMDAEAEELGGKRSFFAGEYAKYGWARLMAPNMGGFDVLALYSEAIGKMNENPGIPALFRDIFKNAYLPYRDPETLRAFLKEIDGFSYDHSERLGDAFEYLLSVLGSQGDAGQFRTPRHIIDFMVEVIDPQKNESVLDPACGTAGFLISAWKHILKQHASPDNKLTPSERANLVANIHGYDISPDMVRLSLVNLYLHGFTDPHIVEYDTLTSEERWNETADVILANPPFMSPKGGIKPHKRFSVPATRSEVLFVDYMAEHLSPQGRAAIVVPEGVIFQSGTAYKKLREMLVKNSLVAVVSLPAGVFNPYSGVKTSILILDKRLAKSCDSVLFVKVENDGFNLGAQRRAVNGSDLPETVRQLRAFFADAPAFENGPMAHKVLRAKIGENGDWGLSGDRYRANTHDHRSDFPSVPIGEICDLLNGRAFKPEDWEKKEDGGMPIIRIQNLNNPDSNFNYYSGEVTERNLIRNGELLFSWSGSRGTSFGAHIWRGGNAVLNQHIFKVVFDESRATKQYLYYALNRAVLAVEENLHGGVGLVHITKGNLERIEIPLPPLAIQQKIVAEIEGYQKIIDGARLVVENYHPRIHIEPDWPHGVLSDVCTLISGQHVDKDDYNTEQIGVEYLTGPSDFGFKNPIATRWTSKPKVFAAEGDILMTVKGSGLGSVNMLGSDSAAISRQLMAIRVQNAEPEFIYAILLAKFDYIQSLGGGAAIPGITREDVLGLQIPLPPIETQRAIVAEIEAEQALVDANKQLIARFEAKIKKAIDRVWGSSA